MGPRHPGHVERRRVLLPEPRAEVELPAVYPSADAEPLVDPRLFQAWATYDRTPTLVVELQAQGPTLTWVNRAGASLLGCAERDLVGRPLSRLRRSPLVPRHGHLPGGPPPLDPTRRTTFDTEVQRDDGTAVPVRLDSTPVGSAVPPRWVLRLHTDVDADRVARDLQASRQRFRALADQAPVGIFCSERGLRLGYVNARMCTLLGLSEHRLLGTDWLEAVHPDDVERVLSALNDVLLGTAAELPLRVVRPDGELRHVHARVVPLREGRDTGFLGTLEDVTERLAVQDLLAHQAQHDPLTGLFNRRALLERTAEELASGRPAALLLLDLDDFKLVNDTCGHDTGDALLGAVAGRLAGAVREQDLVARFGGDEFAVLCLGVADEDAARQVADRLLRDVTGPVQLAQGTYSVAGSLGVALSRPGASPRDLLRDADVAMYQAKAQGKSTWALFDERARDRVQRRQALVEDLREALHRGALTVAYQPLVAVGPGRMVGVEALARWDHPERGPVPPQEFVELAEQHGLVAQLGRAVLREACAQLVRWTRDHGDAAPGTVSVNVSVLQLRSPGFVAEVAALLAETGLPGERLCLELTESAVLADRHAAVRTLSALRDLGVRIALDDFGTGYSSLAVLRSLPVDQLKIDRTFLADLARSGSDVVVAAVVGLAAALGLEAVAEGVETDDQHEELQRLGCPVAQGYLFGRPLPPAELAAHLGPQASAR